MLMRNAGNRLLLYDLTSCFAVSKNNPQVATQFSACASRDDSVITYHHEQLCDINLTYDTQCK